VNLSSTAFESGDAIPLRHTCEGDDVSPPLVWSDVPEGTRAFALVVDDPDAPGGTFTHWLAWGIDPGANGLREGEPAPHEGRNGFGTDGYEGPAPPPRHGAHRYVFRLHALDRELDAPDGADRAEIDRALEGHVLDVAELVGTFER